MFKSLDAVYMFTDPTQVKVDQVRAGLAPRGFHGILQLQERGLAVQISDAQWEGYFGAIRKRLRPWIELPSVQTILDLARARKVVIQGRPAALITIIAILLGTRVVYIDAMFGLPRHPLRRWQFKMCFSMAQAVICFSARQADIWSKDLNIDRDKFVAVCWPMDGNFYKRPNMPRPSRPFVLAVGRDLGRDFRTLIAATEAMGMDLKLVTTSYLLPEEVLKAKSVEVLGYVSYEELFALYAQASISAVILKDGILYPSGTRATLESMLLSTPVVATRTLALEEHFEDEQHLLFVEPLDQDGLVRAIRRILHDPGLSQRLASCAREKVLKEFNTDQLANSLEAVLRDS